MRWLARILVLAFAAVLIDAVVASLHGTTLALGSVGVGAVLALVAIAVFWARPWIATAWSFLMLAGAFAAGTLNGVDPGPALTAMSPQDAAAVVFALGVLAATVGVCVAVRVTALRAIAIVVGLYSIVATLATVQHGGLSAAFASAPLASTRGTYVGAEILLPLAALVVLIFGIVELVRRRGARSVAALVLAFALLATSHLGALAAGAVGLPTIVAFEHPVVNAAGVNTAGAGSPQINQPPASAQSPASASVSSPAALGPATVDDGIVSTKSFATKTTGDVNAVIGALSPAETNTAQPSGSPPAYRDLDNAIPQREYSLDALADSLAGDPAALDAFVRDNVGLDVYDGALRGPLGAWLNRAANPTDKLLLLAWLLAKKGTQIQFVRGTLSESERTQIAQSATQTQPVVVPIAPSTDAANARYVQTRVAAGENFAAWSLQKIGTNVPLGSGAYSAARVPARHYWLQIDRGGRPYALDPTLASTKDGEHLGTADGSFQPSALLPSEDYHVARVRFMQTASDGSSKPVASVEGRIANLAYTPIRVSLASDPAPATSVTALLVVGSNTIGSATIATSGSNAPAQLVLEVERRDPGGVSTTDRRVVYDKTRDGTDLRARALGLHTMVLAPGSAPALFLHETYRNMMSLSDNVAAARNHTTPTFSGTYPQLIADYLTRDDIVAATLSEKNKIRLYRDRANLIELHTTVVNAAGSARNYMITFDIADNGQNAVGDGQTVAHANLVRGWADTWIEKDLLTGSGAMTTLLAVKAQHTPFDVLTKPTASTDPIRAGLDDELSAGRIALAPKTAANGRPGFAWWEIDPSTGTAVGRTTGGYGTEGAEESMLLRFIQGAMFGFETVETGAECAEHGLASVGCAAAVCGLAISAALSYVSMAHTLTVGKLIGETAASSGMGVMCNTIKGPSGGGGGEDPSPSAGGGE
jgi:septal ring-binding cell division protein DamX